MPDVNIAAMQTKAAVGKKSQREKIYLPEVALGIRKIINAQEGTMLPGLNNNGRDNSNILVTVVGR